MMPSRATIFRAMLNFTLLASASIPCRAEDPASNTRSLLRKLPGPQPGGGMLLPNQWSLQPTGKQVEIGNFPVNVALHPEGEWAVVLHAGYGPHAVMVVEVKSGRVVASIVVPRSFCGLCFSPSGQRLFVSGGEDDVIHEFHFADGYLYGHKAIELPKTRRPWSLRGCHAVSTASGSTWPAASAIDSSSCGPAAAKTFAKSVCRRKAIPICRS